ncbi:MAG: phage protein Gp27 family protein [Pseudomonadota bacterium]
MARRHTPSTIDRLPREIRELIGDLRRDGHTIDEIMVKLSELRVDVSRSAVGRHVKGLAEIAERMKHSRAVAEALVGQFGEQADDKVARANIELMHTVVMQTITASAVDEQTGASRPVTFSPEDAMFLGRTLQSLSSAAKATDDRIRKAREEATKSAAEKATAAARQRGLTAETVDFIRHAVLGTTQ